MKHLKTFEQYTFIEPKINEGLFSKENIEGRERLSKQFDEITSDWTASKKPWGKLGDPTKIKEKWMQKAKDEDNYKGEFSIDRGVMQYHSKSSNPIQGKTGGSSGYGTANK